MLQNASLLAIVAADTAKKELSKFLKNRRSSVGVAGVILFEISAKIA